MPSEVYAKGDIQSFFADPRNYIYRRNWSDGPFLVERMYERLGALAAPRSAAAERDYLYLMSSKRDIAQQLLDFLAETSLLRMTAKRGDWLYVETKAALVLNGLAWLAMLVDGEFDPPDREGHLRQFCGRFAPGSSFNRALAPADLKPWCDALMALVLETAAYLRAEWGEFELASTGMLADFQRDPELVQWWPPQRATDAEKWDLVEQIDRQLRKMPVHLGTLLTGSFADADKRRTGGDVDIECLCSELPDAAMRAGFVKAMAPRGGDGFGSFQFLGMDDKRTADLCFISVAQQDAYMQNLDEGGLGDAYHNFAESSYAISAYHLSRGQIVSDRDGLLAAYQQRGRQLPAAYRRAVEEKWRAVWARYEGDFAAGQRRGDRLRALTALNLCTEAALRAALIRRGIDCNPVEPKWLPIEIGQAPDLSAALGAVPGDVSAPLAERFALARAIWDRGA